MAILTVSRETVDRLEHYVDLLHKWSSRINLIGPATRQDVWRRHVADSAQLHRLSRDAPQWIDIGSGAGFPGAVLAILLAERESGWVHLVESNNKKAAFLRHVLSETDARGSVHACRIEALDPATVPADHVSARAVTDLARLLGLTAPWLARAGTVGYFHKGRDYQRELKNARGDWEFDLIEHASRIDRDSVILELRNVSLREGGPAKGRP